MYQQILLEKLFQERFPQALDNLEKLIQAISYDLDTSLKLPRFNPARPAVEELRERAELGLAQKGLTGKEYQDRLDQVIGLLFMIWALMIILGCLGFIVVLDVRMLLYGNGTRFRSW